MNDNVQVKFGGDTSDLDGDLNKLGSEFKSLFGLIETEVRQMSNVVQSEMKQASSSMRQVKTEGHGLKSMFGEVKSSLAGLAAGYGLGQLLKGVISTSIEFERLRAILTTLEGDAAETRFAALQQFAKETPYDLQQVVTAFAKLKGAGLDPGNEALRAYGNTAASTGKSLLDYTEAITDAAVGEMERLKEFNIKAKQSGEQVAFTFQGVTTTVGRNADEIQKYLQSIGNTKFAGGMDRQMKTLGGAFSNLKDVAATTADEIGRGGLSAALTDIARDMIAAGEGSMSLAKELGSGLGVVIASVWEIVKTFGEVVSSVFSAITDVIQAFTGNTQSNGDLWITVFRSVLTVINGFGVGVRVVMLALVAIIKSVTQSFITFGDIINRVFHLDFSGALAAFRNWGTTQVGIAKQTAGDIVGALRDGRERQDKIWAAPPKVKSVALPSYVAPKATPGASKGDKDKKGDGDAARKAALRKEVEEQISAIDLKMDAERDSLVELIRLQDEKLAVYRRAYTEDSSEYRNAFREKLRMERDYQQEALRLVRDRIEQTARLNEIGAESDTNILRTELEARKAAIEDAGGLGDLNPNERNQLLRNVLEDELRLEEQHAAEIYAIHRKSIALQLALENLKPDERRRLNNELAQIDAEYAAQERELAATRRAQIDQFSRNTAKSTRQIWEAALQPITQQFASFFNGMLTGAQSFRQGMIQIMDNLVSQFVNQIAEMANSWLAGEIAKRTSSQATAAVTAATAASSAATSTAASAASGTAQVGTNAAVGASGAFASIAAIPVVGPFMAPMIAAGVMAAIMGFGSLISARGGADIGPGVNPMAQLHEEEMVLPAHIANPLRSMLSGAGPRASGMMSRAASAGADARTVNQGGDKYEFNYQPKHTNMDAGFDTLLRNDGQSLRKWLANEVRNGSFKMKRT